MTAENSDRKLSTVRTSAGPLKLSRKGWKFAGAIRDGAARNVAAKISGLSERHCGRLLANPVLKAWLRDQARDALAHALPLAAERVVSLLKQDDARKVSLDAAQLVLGIGNIRPPQGPASQVNVNIHGGAVLYNDEDAARLADMRGGYAIDLRPVRPAKAPAVIEHQLLPVPSDAA